MAEIVVLENIDGAASPEVSDEIAKTEAEEDECSCYTAYPPEVDKFVRAARLWTPSVRACDPSGPSVRACAPYVAEGAS